MKVIMQENIVAVESINKIRKKRTQSLLVIPDNNDNTGVIRFIGNVSSQSSLHFKIGDVVCFGNQRENTKISGIDLDIMDVSNIYAILEEEESNEEESTKTQA